MLLAANEVHQVGHVGLIEDREVGRQAERPTVQTQESIGDRVERATPDFAGAVAEHEPVGA